MAVLNLPIPLRQPISFGGGAFNLAHKRTIICQTSATIIKES